MSGLVCHWVQLALAAEAARPRLDARLAFRHLASCGRCRAFLAQLERVEDGLAVLAATAAEPGSDLERRTWRSFTEPRAGQSATRPRRSALLWLAGTCGTAAVLLLVAALARERVEALGAPPRTVHIVLPADVTLSVEPRLLIRRADGTEEVRR